MFAQCEITAQLPSYLTPLAEFVETQQAGLLWVAVNEQDEPIGFALVELLEGLVHLEELDVLPAYGRRGIGTKLVRSICDWATRQNLPVTLTTFRDIPWNAPFYARCGFEILAEDELSPALQARVAEEIAHGWPADLRVVMKWQPS